MIGISFLIGHAICFYTQCATVHGFARYVVQRKHVSTLGFPQR